MNCSGTFSQPSNRFTHLWRRLVHRFLSSRRRAGNTLMIAEYQLVVGSKMYS
ncbi:hypothetical protein CY34DRAFT_375261 [Suillus luteus UH-Slu-Lm8-n1]|uniref:Uncharacterized protein n=1 Tax=Suillus luteus UH-Slu-Lm8-n1 TaxID=930992 RepID=A0A0D0AWE5_9AGAM|nr:hypothetical protein CY34DRAFT_375261 [Suillus luteus UH-Slu-Lm8-n1]